MSEEQPLKKLKPSQLRLKLKIKEKTEPIPCTSELIDLLTQLNEGKPLELTLLASLHEAASRGQGFGRVGAMKYTKSTSTKEETLMMHLHNIFQEHIGKSPEVIVENALRTAREVLLMEEKIDKSSEEGDLFGDERQRQLNHPELHQFVYGPNLDGKVWLALFLGQERADKLLDPEKTAPLNSLEILENSNLKAIERIVLETLSMEVSFLSIDVLMFNILKYIRDLVKVNEMQDITKLLRFSVLYGLDGVMKDILRGRYGHVGDFSTVNSFLIVLDDTPIVDTSGDDLLSIRKRLYWPLYAVGALVGHKNIVTVALKELGGIYDAPSCHDFSHRLEEGLKIDGDHTLPSELFHWVLHKNMPDMVECLVKECGFQFRWIDHKKYILKSMFKTLFLVSDFPRPPWDGDIDEEEDMFFLSSGQIRKARAKASYKSKMKMLDLLISLGFPFELFFPTEPLFEKEELVRKNGKLQENTQEWLEYFNSLTKDQRKAIIRIDSARGSYNRSHSYKDALTSSEFYKKLKTRWEEGQETSQISKLDEYEALDSRWRKWRRRQDGEESESDDDSDLEEYF